MHYALRMPLFCPSSLFMPSLRDTGEILIHDRHSCICISLLTSLICCCIPIHLFSIYTRILRHPFCLLRCVVIVIRYHCLLSPDSAIIIPDLANRSSGEHAQAKARALLPSSLLLFHSPPSPHAAPLARRNNDSTF